MRILLLAMPDNVDLIDHLIKFPNIAIVSLAGNLPGHEVKTMDLVVYGHHIKEPLVEVVEDFKPELIGLSAMTFQFDTLLRISAFLKDNYPEIKLIAGGYHATLMAEEVCRENDDLPLDFFNRGEGEQALPELCEQLSRKHPDYSSIAGVSFKDKQGVWHHNPRGELLDLNKVELPDRESRIKNNFYLFGSKKLSFDVIETSRGCPFLCKFCSIRGMYGATFRPFPMERIIEDLRRIKAKGTTGVFIADDNITYDVDHFRKFCQAVVENGLNDLVYSVQLSAVGIAKNPELAADMEAANFQIAFVGFESMIPSSLTSMKKPTNPEINIQAARLLRKHKVGVIAGVIVGYPDDTKESIKNNFRAVMKLLPDVVYPQYLTPYPKTELRDEMLAADMVVNKDDLSKYDGYTCNVRTKHLTKDEIYVALRKEMFLNFFYPSIGFNNLSIRRYPFLFIKALFFNNLLTIIWDILTRRKNQSKFDI